MDFFFFTIPLFWLHVEVFHWEITPKQNDKKFETRKTHTKHLRKTGEKKKLNENVDVYTEFHY